MNNAGITVNPSPIAAAAPGATRAVSGKQADFQFPERGGRSDDPKLISFHHFAKSAAVKGDGDDEAHDDQPDDTMPAVSPSVTFDSLFMQIERKLLGQQPESAAGPDLNSESQDSVPNQSLRATDAPVKPDVSGAKVLHFPQNLTRKAAEQDKLALSKGINNDINSIGSDSLTKVSGDGKSIEPDRSKLVASAGLEIVNSDSKDGQPEAPVASGQFGHTKNVVAYLGASSTGHSAMAERDEHDSPGKQGHDPAKSQHDDARLLAMVNGTAPTNPNPNDSGLKVSAPALADQISKALQSNAVTSDVGSFREGESRSITVRLSPEGMGRLSIRLEKVDGMLKVSLAAERESTSDSLKAASPDLARALESSIPGFSANDLSFSTMSQQDGDARQDFKQNGPNSGVAGNEQGREHAAGQNKAPLPAQVYSIPALGETVLENRAAGPRTGRYNGGVLYV